MFKVYCGVLNGRLVTWAEVNELVCDEQNGFHKNRSTVDHLSSLWIFIYGYPHLRMITIFNSLFVNLRWSKPIYYQSGLISILILNFILV